jgi:hypothetical protein
MNRKLSFVEERRGNKNAYFCQSKNLEEGWWRAQVVEILPSKLEALSSNHSTINKTKTKNKQNKKSLEE